MASVATAIMQLDEEVPWPALRASSVFEQIANHYHFPEHLSGAGECIGILAFGGGISRSDLTKYFHQQTGVVPDVRFENVSTTNEPNLNAQHDLELALDLQIVGRLAPGARLVVYFGANDEAGWIHTVRRAIHDQRNRPTILSISWGATEDWWSAATIEVLNQLFEEAARSGITICAASGDTGCAKDQDGHCRVTFPASSPFVLACGGISFAVGNREVVWNVRNKSGSGGGISDRLPRPPWQPLAHLPSIPLRKNPHFDGRQLPDVSGLAGNSYCVYVGGSYRNFVAGTSAVAALWSALIARLNEGLQHRGLPRVGYFHPRLYRELSIQHSFCNITIGHNDPFGTNGYQAGSGWNFCNGWGSPDGAKLLEALSAREHTQKGLTSGSRSFL